MIRFQRLNPEDMAQYREPLFKASVRGCEYSFVNRYLWGKQKAAWLGDSLCFFSEFDRHNVYSFPTEPNKAVIDAILADAAQRRITCCMTSMNREDCDTLEALYPGQFHFHIDRSAFDYIYSAEELSELKGRKFQKKRNHIHRFEEAHPECRTVPMDSPVIRAKVQAMLQHWYASRAEDLQDYHMEQRAFARAFIHWDELGLEGLALVEDDTVLAFSAASRLNDNTYDIHFEKAREDADGAYAAINREFARYLHQAHPDVEFLNREDDLGLEGLRKAKLSYCPHHLVEKFWACPVEDDDED